ncbi:MAG: DUF2797 domain-containing protein [Candidatus ainarchaeum sp.]|nr:DUF2797 domain-containing protein [Candidatus ainarchaeum sp.]
MHLINFFPNPEPEISYWESRAIEKLKLEGEVRIQFQNVRACIGYNDGKEYHSCINSEIDTRQCHYCASKDISKVYTRMDLSGFEHLEEEIVNRPYSLYLAYFGKDIIKCGVCRKERLDKRVKEQAAFYFAHLMDFDNANDAYGMEKLLQHNFGLRNAVRNSTKLKNMKNIDTTIFSQILSEIKETPPFSDYILNNAKIEKINYNLPEDFSISKDSIDGIILGSMGSFLFFKNEENTFTIDLKDKKGEYFRFF